MIRRPIDGKLDWPFATIPPRLILFNSCQNDFNRLLMCIKLHHSLQIYIPHSCPSVARILESLIIHFTIRLSVVPSILFYPTLTSVFLMQKNLMEALKNPRNRNA
jgi:hypothetical protein